MNGLEDRQRTYLLQQQVQEQGQQQAATWYAEVNTTICSRGVNIVVFFIVYNLTSDRVDQSVTGRTLQI